MSALSSCCPISRRRGSGKLYECAPEADRGAVLVPTRKCFEERYRACLSPVVLLRVSRPEKRLESLAKTRPRPNTGSNPVGPPEQEHSGSTLFLALFRITVHARRQ